MNRIGSAAVLFVITLVTVISPPPSHALASLWTREGTVDYALRQEDGQSVSLDSVIVAGVSENLLFVRDPWPRSPVLAVAASGTKLRSGNIVDIRGVMSSTSDNKSRLLVPSSIKLYIMDDGTPIPLFPKAFQPWGWSCFEDVAFYSSDVDTDSKQISKSSASSIPTDSVPEEGTIAWAKMQPDFNPQNPSKVTLENKLVVADMQDFPECFYIIEDDRSSGIRVKEGPFIGQNKNYVYITRGDRVTISGHMQTDESGERYIHIYDANYYDTDPVPVVESRGNTLPKSLGMVARSVGGGDFKYDIQSGTGQVGVIDEVGLNNVGLLARVWGKVTYVDTAKRFFYLDDGSHIEDGSGHVGLRVDLSLSPELRPPMPEVDDYVTALNGMVGLWTPDPEGNPNVRKPVINWRPDYLRPVWTFTPDSNYGGNGRAIAVVGNTIYYTVRQCQQIVKYDFVNEDYSVADLPNDEICLGCLDYDSSDESLWGASYTPGYEGYVYHMDLNGNLLTTPPSGMFALNDEANFPGMEDYVGGEFAFAIKASVVDGLTVDGSTLWISSDADSRVYHSSKIGLPTTPPAPNGYFDKLGLAISGHEHTGAHLWIARVKMPDGHMSVLYVLNSDGDVIHSFYGPSHEIEDLDWDGEYMWAIEASENIGRIFKMNTGGVE